jgi:hypothetical protein
MEILEILKNSKDEIYPEDLDFFETELATGEYDEAYIAACKEQIALIRNWMAEKDSPTEEIGTENSKSSKSTGKTLVMGIHDVAPGSANPLAASMSPEDIIFSDINSIRESDSYKTRFKKYVKEKPEIDSAFVHAHYYFFLSWELDAIVSVTQLGEAFLEKYFGALDKGKISRYQCFSESFFMKHYSQLDATVILTKGKNEWRKKENRSRQLDVFLRLKGVKL